MGLAPSEPPALLPPGSAPPSVTSCCSCNPGRAVPGGASLREHQCPGRRPQHSVGPVHSCGHSRAGSERQPASVPEFCAQGSSAQNALPSPCLPGQLLAAFLGRGQAGATPVNDPSLSKSHRAHAQDCTCPSPTRAPGMQPVSYFGPTKPVVERFQPQQCPVHPHPPSPNRTILWRGASAAPSLPPTTGSPALGQALLPQALTCICLPGTLHTHLPRPLRNCPL